VFNPQDVSPNIVTYLLIYGGVVLVASWVAMIAWAYRDMRARSRDIGSQILFALIVLVLNLPGLIIYVFLRPRETLSEAYERSLEEEALLQEIEEKPNCPGCGQRVDHEWQACPYCHTRLKKPCINCSRMLQLSWDLCPHCATPQTTGTVDSSRAHVTRSVRGVDSSDGGVDPGLQQSQPWEDPMIDSRSAAQPGLEFIDEDYR
jgi:RNA polymerase subunit RPABC4/transcription elongation factor Spt4